MLFIRGVQKYSLRSQTHYIHLFLIQIFSVFYIALSQLSLFISLPNPRNGATVASFIQPADDSIQDGAQ